MKHERSKCCQQHFGYAGTRQLAGIAKERKSESEHNERTNSSLAVWTEHTKKDQNKLVGFVRGETKGTKE